MSFVKINSDGMKLYFNNQRVDEINIKQLIETNHSTIGIAVDGFWSIPVTIYVCKDVFSNKWKVDVSHSSGGRLKENNDKYKIEDGYVGVENDLVAEMNFGKAVVAACEIAMKIENELSSI